MKSRITPLLGIFITVFLDMLSFGMFIPDIQVRGEKLGAEGWMLGLMIATFSIAQFATAPILGRLSDRIGRRKILLFSTLLSAASFVAYGFASSLWLIFLSRMLGGIAAANVGVAYAYVADVTSAEDRSKGMGIVGAGFGLGFIFGPPLGLLCLHLAGGQPGLLGAVGAVLAFVNFAYIALLLPEPERKASTRDTAFTVANLLRAIGTPGLGLLLLLFFSYNFAFTNLESTYLLLAIHRFGMTQDQAGLVLVLVGVVMAVMQGILIRPLTKRFGEVALMRTGFLIVGPMLALVPFAWPWPFHVVGVILLGIGSGMCTPSLGSLVSKSAPPDMQGGIFGVTQALGALARIIGPIVANSLFVKSHVLPYFLAGALMAVPALGAWFVRFRQDSANSEPLPH